MPCRKAFESADGLHLKEAFFLENRDFNALKGALAAGVAAKSSRIGVKRPT